MGYQATNDGWHKIYDTNITAVETGPTTFRLARPNNMVTMLGVKGVRLSFLGDTADDDFRVAIYGVDPVGIAQGDTAGQYKSELLYTIRAVIGAGTGEGPVDSKHVGLLDLYADAITSITEATIIADLQVYWNIDGQAINPELLSPGGDGYAEVLLNSTFGYTWWSFNTTVFDTGDSFNVLYKLDRLKTE